MTAFGRFKGALDGKDITDAPASKRRMGIVFQGYALFENMTVMQNLTPATLFPRNLLLLMTPRVKRVRYSSLNPI